jgi:hypothetical protein
VRFQDLSKSKQAEIKADLLKRISEDVETQEYLAEACGHDAFDMDKPDSDRIAEHISGGIERGCDEAWLEMGVGVTL